MQMPEKQILLSHRERVKLELSLPLPSENCLSAIMNDEGKGGWNRFTNPSIYLCLQAEFEKNILLESLCIVRIHHPKSFSSRPQEPRLSCRQVQPDKLTPSGSINAKTPKTHSVSITYGENPLTGQTMMASTWDTNWEAATATETISDVESTTYSTVNIDDLFDSMDSASLDDGLESTTTPISSTRSSISSTLSGITTVAIFSPVPQAQAQVQTAEVTTTEEVEETTADYRRGL
jgi:hypothetical protein